MRRTFVTTVTGAIALAASIGMPSSASAQVVVIIGNGAAQPYYAPPYPYTYAYPHSRPYSFPHVVYREPYPTYGYFAEHYHAYDHGYYGNAYYRPYDYGW